MKVFSRELTLPRFHDTPYDLYNYMELIVTFETSTTSAKPVSNDPGFVEK